MSNETISLNAQKREVLGKQVRALRAEGQTPAVVHDHGKESMHIVVSEKELKKVYSNAGKHHTVILSIDGKKHTTLVKEVTYRPATNQVYHTVFQAVSANETVKTEVPIRLVGDEIPAEIAGFLMLQNLDHLEVEGLPKDLIDSVEVDVTGLAEVGDKITVADLKVPAGIEIKTDPEQTVVAVEMPKDQIADADAALAEDAEINADGSEATTEEEAIAEMPEPDAEGSKNSSDTNDSGNKDES